MLQSSDLARFRSSRFVLGMICCAALLGTTQAGVHAATADGAASLADPNQAPIVTNPGAQTNSNTLGYAQVVLADAPVAYWRLGETTGATAVDSAGTNPATVFGGVTLGQAGALADGN